MMNDPHFPQGGSPHRESPHGESAGAGGRESGSRNAKQPQADHAQAERHDSADDIQDPFFKDPAKTVGQDVAKSLAVGSRDSTERPVIRDAFTAEVPNEPENPEYDGASYGAQMDRITRDKQRESDSRPKGINANDIEAIYGMRWKSEDSLTINEGRPKKHFSIWDIPGLRLLVKLAVLAAIVMGIFAIRLPIVDEDGVDTTSALPIWIYQQATMSSEQEMMQDLDPLERHFAVTLLRIRRVSSAAARFELSESLPPSSAHQLLDKRLIRESRISDGWGNLFRIETQGQTIVIRSAGKDRAFNTDDDITVLGDSPPGYSAPHYSRESEAINDPY